MIFIDGKNISIPKGDIGIITFVLTGDVPDEGVEIKLIISNKTTTITKESAIDDEGTVSFYLSGEDTSIKTGRYSYSLRIVRIDGYDTPICSGNLTIMEVIDDGN